MNNKKVVVPRERGVKIIHNPVLNKGTAFTTKEREILGLRGLLPPKVLCQELQAQRIMENLKKKPNDLEKYIYLVSLQDRNENLFYYVLGNNIKELMPIIYTPTVGQACQHFGHIYRRSRGLYISLEDKGHIREILHNWPHDDARIMVVTDGGRILGLGDLGVSGMGIPIGKLALYTACAGIDPTKCLPITIDVGTNNEALLMDPLYLGHQHQRISGKEYDELLDEFMAAALEVFPNIVIQLEDFATDNAFNLLHKYKDKICIFDDDIQGTAGVALAGILSALKLTKQNLEDQRILFLGAGEAGIGIGDIIVSAMQEKGLDYDQAKSQNWFMDSKGLVCAERSGLGKHKLPYAHNVPYVKSLEEAVETFKPTILIGVSGQPSQFTKEVIQKMSKINKRPIIFALSNPTSKSECTAHEAYQWSEGQAIFASGSPFDPVDYNGKTFIPGQGNNVYIFPGVGLGLIYSKSHLVTDKMFLEAAKVLSSFVSEADLSNGTVYPSFDNIREISAAIATAVTNIAIDERLSQKKKTPSMMDHISKKMYQPDYPSLF